ncbi:MULTISPECIES: DUF2625 domain-containing protein [Flavobacterium]|uniref:DUF2625 domain-containing protein n=1 Tax=Flavobacterium TaxID=237 RepID=UPI00214EF9B0|nr:MULTISPECIES: DUF2625 domain-containing protein [Flavobacterium]MCR4033447.1 DUF2625 domain-containing protein [Flavobacterium panacis]
MKFFQLTAFIFLTTITFSQTKMRPVNELIDQDDSGWKLIKEWIDSAKNKVEVLPADPQKAKDALYQVQVTTKSPMGAVVYKTGGILIDNGWIRILGSGSSKLNRSLPDWNKGKSFKEAGETPSFLLIADDALGGFYILNGGALGQDLGKVYYFSPDNLEYEPLDISYSEFLGFCFTNDLDKFYAGSRWENWKKEVPELQGDQVFNFYPFLWTEEGSDINKVQRKIIPIEEQYSLNLDLRKQLGH